MPTREETWVKKLRQKYKMHSEFEIFITPKVGC